MAYVPTLGGHLSRDKTMEKITSRFSWKRKEAYRLRSQVQFKVYCKCRQPEDGRMVQCDL